LTDDINRSTPETTIKEGIQELSFCETQRADYKTEENKHILRSEGDNSDNTLETLIKDLHMGFKLVPLGSDSIPAVSSTNEIYNNPDYWTEKN